MDEIGRRYLLLALRLGRHLPRLIDFYVGPPELAEVVAAEDETPLVELHHEAMRLQELASESAAPSASAASSAATTAERRRHAWLADQLTALDALARALDGEEIAYVDLVEELFGVPAEPEPASTFATARRLLDGVLPPGPSLRERLAAHEASTLIAPEVAVPAISWIAAVLRERTRRDFWLPDGESVELVAVRDRPWNAYAAYQGAYRTRIEINLDRPVPLAQAVFLAAHEAYPGHHAERATKDAVLVRRAGWEEGMVGCLFTPEASISEGLADLAREVVLTDLELGTMYRRLVRALALPIEPSAAEREVAVQRGRAFLRRAVGNAALAFHRDGMPDGEVQAYLADEALYDDARVATTMARLRDPIESSYDFAYLAGPRLLTEWLEAQGQTRGFARLLSEPLSPGQLRSELGEPPPLYPSDFV